MPARQPKKSRRTGFQPSLRDLRMMKWPPPTVTALAKEIDVSQPHLSNVEKGTSAATPRLLFKLAIYYGLTREQIQAAYAETVRRLKAGEDDPQVESSS